jgi:hypothetical protein
MATEPGGVVRRLEAEPALPTGAEERFAGYGIMGLPLAASSARIGGVDLGAPGPLTPQAYLGEFLIPQHGLFVIASAMFEPAGVACHASGGSIGI